jgi:hypothetical protein
MRMEWLVDITNDLPAAVGHALPVPVSGAINQLVDLGPSAVSRLAVTALTFEEGLLLTGVARLEGELLVEFERLCDVVREGSTGTATSRAWDPWRRIRRFVVDEDVSALGACDLRTGCTHATHATASPIPPNGGCRGSGAMWQCAHEGSC